MAREILSSGEISPADKVMEAGRRTAAGQQVRILDIAADEGRYGAFETLHGHADGSSFANNIKQAAATSFGLAGPMFVEELLKDLDQQVSTVQSKIKAFVQMVRERVGNCLDGQVMRAAERFGLVAAAGEAATRFELTGWPRTRQAMPS